MNGKLCNSKFINESVRECWQRYMPCRACLGKSGSPLPRGKHFKTLLHFVACIRTFHKRGGTVPYWGKPFRNGSQPTQPARVHVAHCFFVAMTAREQFMRDIDDETVEDKSTGTRRYSRQQGSSSTCKQYFVHHFFPWIHISTSKHFIILSFTSFYNE
jgi:hypothetical protein